MVGKWDTWRKAERVMYKENLDCRAWQEWRIQKTEWSKMGAAKKRLQWKTWNYLEQWKRRG